MVRFDETQRGRKFYDAQLPKLIKTIEENTKALNRANELKELELKSKGVITDEEQQEGHNSVQDGRG